MNTQTIKSLDELKADAAALAEQIAKQERADRELAQLNERAQRLLDAVPAKVRAYESALDVHCKVRDALRAIGHDVSVFQQGGTEVAPTPDEVRARYEAESKAGEYPIRVRLRFAFEAKTAISIFYDDSKDTVCVSSYAVSTTRRFRKRNNGTYNVAGIAAAFSEMRAGEIARHERKQRELNLKSENATARDRIVANVDTANTPTPPMIEGTATITPSEFALDRFTLSLRTSSVDEATMLKIVNTLNALGVVIK